MEQNQMLEEKQVHPAIKDRVAVVTGGARGLGEAVCRKLAEAGASVVIADFRRGLAEETAARLSEGGARVSAEFLDVRDEKSVRNLVESIVEKAGRLDFLVNNAAVDKTVSIEELSVEEWDCVMATNLRGPFVLSKAVLPVMRRQKSGHIVNMASTAAKRTWANASAYHASKWGLLGFSHALHVEARQHGVKVTAVVAGGMRTPFLLDRFPDIDPGVLQNPDNVADTIRYVLTQPAETVIPEVMVLPMRETSWP